MSLLDRLRPKWQHSDTEVRAAAVRQLGKEDAELLGAVAQSDPDPRVRRIAVKKLDDPRLLLEIGRSDADDGLRAFATERANSILVEIATSDQDPEQSERAVTLVGDQKQIAAVVKTARLGPIRRAALDRLNDDKALADVVRSSEDSVLRSNALEKITDKAILRTLTVVDNGDLAVQAVERIDDPDVLIAIIEDRATNKSARRVAEEKLDKLIDDDHPIRQTRRHELQLRLCGEVEALVEEPSMERAVERLQRALSQWKEWSQAHPIDERLQQRFQQAAEAVLERKSVQDKRRSEQEQKQRAALTELASRTALCEQAERLGPEDLPEKLEALEADWKALGPATADQAMALSKRFDAACEGARARQAEWNAWNETRSLLESLVREAEQAIASPDLVEGARRFNEVKARWPKIYDAAPPSGREEELHAVESRFAATGQILSQKRGEERARRRALKEETLKRTQEVIDRLDTLSEAQDLVLTEAFRELRDSQTFLKEMGPLPPGENRKKWRAKISEARQRLHSRVQDYRETDEWRRWANVDLQEKLIKKMESLLEVEDLREASMQLRAIQLEWKQVSAAPKAQADSLWRRFKKARDEVRSRCDAFFDTLDKERSENLEKKKALCQHVEALSDSTDWEKTAIEIKKIQNEWKRIGAVPQRESNAVWKRFRKACDHFFDRRKDHYSQLKRQREDNLKLKVSLCEKAEALAHSTDWRATADELKRLQSEWKSVGPVPRKKSDSVWKRFRNACDHFFDRYKRRDEVELAENLHMKEAICEELESLQPAGDDGESPGSDVIARRVRDAWMDWKKIGLVPKEQEEPIESRFRRICERLVCDASTDLRGTELDPTVNHRKREKLCERLEKLVRTYSRTGGDSASLDDLAERLKSALAARTIGGEPSKEPELDWKEALRQAKRLKVNWDRLGPVPGEAGEALIERFQKAYSRFLDLRPTTQARSSGQASTGPSAHR